MSALTELPEATTEDVASSARAWMSLGEYRPAPGFSPGRSAGVCLAWYVVSLVVFQSGWFPVYSLKRWLLRRFGARIGRGVVIKPHVRIKYPWRLTIGDHSWIGEDVWIDNLAEVAIGRDVCVSQGAYLCTGSHDCRRVTFDLITAPIVVADGAWIATRALLLPGVQVGPGAVVAAGATATRDIAEGMIVAGCPARALSRREASTLPTMSVRELSPR